MNRHERAKLSFGAAVGVIALVIVALAPRFFWWCCPRIHVSDSCLVYMPYLASVGDLPYRDFPFPYNPGTICLLAPLYFVFGASLATAEFTTAAMFAAVTFLVFKIGARLVNRTAGCLSAVFFAWHPLIIGYHVFQVECGVLFCECLGMWFVVRRDVERRQDVSGLRPCASP